MSNYIDRKALLDAFCNENCNLNYDGTCHNCRSTEIIADFQASDASPVVHGKWIFDDAGYCRCSVCGQKCASYVNDEALEARMTYYCHYCGAKMDL